MTQSKDAYQALESIVGLENITDEPAIMDTYSFYSGAEALTPDQSRFLLRPAAVVLPGSAEEVQAIVRNCNRYKIKCKPIGTGWNPSAAASTEDTVILDLRRMNRILEIDEQNMFAVVEPYVIAGQLQAEVMKRGLNCHMIGAGASSSVVAASTSFVGDGPDSIMAGCGSETVLGMEWVMPTGDVLRTGSLGSGAGWFCGEGPGPSVRGIARGLLGGAGAWGVFTKVAVKLFNWPGPPVLPVEGVLPGYNSPLPDNFRAYTLTFPTNQAYTDALYMIYDAGIGYIINRQLNFFGEDLAGAMVKILSDHTKTIDNLEEMLEKPEIQKLTDEVRGSMQIVLVGNSVDEVQFQENVLNHILDETGGKNVAAMADPAIQRWVLLFLLRMPFKSLNYVYGGGVWSGFSFPGTPDYTVSYMDEALEIKRKYIATGGIVDDGGDAFIEYGSFIGGGGYTYPGVFVYCDSADRELVKHRKEFKKDTERFRRERRLTPNMGGYFTGKLTGEQREKLLSGERQPAVYHWQRKIKEVFDPNGVGDDGYSWLESRD